MELLATLALGMAPHAPVTPAITAANATVIAILSATGHLTGLNHASEALNTGYVTSLGHLAASGSLSDNITTWFHHAAGSSAVLVVLTALCFIDGFLPPLPPKSVAIGLTSWFIASPPSAVMPLWTVLPAAGVGAMLGDSFAFFLGTRIPMEEIPFLNRGKERTAYDLARRTLHRRGTSLVFATRFIPGGRIAVDIYVGAANFGYARFLHTDFMAVMCWMAYGMTIGTISRKIVSRVHLLLAVAMGVTGGLVSSLMMDRLMSWVQKHFWDKPTPDSSGSWGACLKFATRCPGSKRPG